MPCGASACAGRSSTRAPIAAPCGGRQARGLVVVVVLPRRVRRIFKSDNAATTATVAALPAATVGGAPRRMVAPLAGRATGVGRGGSALALRRCVTARAGEGEGDAGELGRSTGSNSGGSSSSSSSGGGSSTGSGDGSGSGGPFDGYMFLSNGVVEMPRKREELWPSYENSREDALQLQLQESVQALSRLRACHVEHARHMCVPKRSMLAMRACKAARACQPECGFAKKSVTPRRHSGAAGQATQAKHSTQAMNSSNAGQAQHAGHELMPNMNSCQT
eukprot:362191-Chlamydomonas_euryale.AAC.2